MTKSDNDVVVTGIGLVTSFGVGQAPHVAMLTGGAAPGMRIDDEICAPYPVHPLPEIDWKDQIPKRGDQRQMENWQRLGVYAAGLALDDAGVKDNEEICSTMDMIVAAGGGERDIAVDTMIVNEARERTDREILLNEKLTTELRPTLFLAQLANLVAGNISIVHKVTGSSRTFMGEEAAGISAVATAYARILAGQSTHTLVGASFVAERRDILLMLEAVHALSCGKWAPLWDRAAEDDGGMIMGSAGAFLVLESRAYAQARGAHIYATLSGVEGDRGKREDGKFEKRFARLLADAGFDGGQNEAIFSGATGLSALTKQEADVLKSGFPDTPLRGYTGMTGHAMEANFPLGIALAALSLDAKAPVPVFNDGEASMSAPAEKIAVTTVGLQRGEGVAVLVGEK
ncbi:beta-ketoacyl-ACP synthase [Martelella radicis]|uniref:3-oxoacyl-[acyl-carrier-protein] synthase II n=1 Tax=Martelella radicis TaxID=1397476 RepID=A0A7W6KGT2_9HYPH|nr:beta-ketoacyl-ACP synthase [Martelella radicis]MBB4120782.1 3-oxoacyl-[acyl-carrier-protein] synthase II [Martelella radicis]